MAWRINVTDPADRPLGVASVTSKRKLPPLGEVPGSKSKEVESRSSPSIEAPHTAATALTAVRCWGRNPGLDRLPLIFLI